MPLCFYKMVKLMELSYNTDNLFKFSKYELIVNIVKNNGKVYVYLTQDSLYPVQNDHFPWDSN